MYWKKRCFVLDCELYGKIWSMNTTFKNIVLCLGKEEMGFVYIG